MQLYSRYNWARRVLVLMVLALAWSVAAQAKSPNSVYQPGPAEYSVVALLGSAQVALSELATLTDADERRLRCSSAISALTGLYQLHGCEWALPALRAVYRHPECPDLHLGYTRDGRVSLRLEPLELRNPAFEQYTVYLCTLESNTALDLAAADSGPLTFEQRDGTQVSAQSLSPGHELWPHLDRLAHTFLAPAALPSGSGIAYKQLFAVPQLSRERISAVSLLWGAYEFELPYYENEAGL
jgi:hypothetical protein